MYIYIYIERERESILLLLLLLRLRLLLYLLRAPRNKTVGARRYAIATVDTNTCCTGRGSTRCAVTLGGDGLVTT